MSQITLIIDGKTCEGTAGQTILEVARAYDIYIPTLCYLEGLSPIGACRMCVVEVEGNAKLLTSCTTPAVDGMVVSTMTDRLKAYRKEILELLFAGRNHFCMYCSQSGDCELQRLAIEHGMDSVRYPYLYGDFHNDVSRDTIQMDHNRCILCLRCVRVCAEKVGAHVLDLEKRGWSANIIADLGKKLGSSESCVDCGACAQVCPTGAITIRDFVYRGRRNDCDDVVESVCPLCSMGCKIKTYVRTGSVVRVEGTSVTDPDGGQLCHKGRWELPRSTEQERVKVPMIRQGSSFREASWDEALDVISSKLKAAGNDKTGVIVSDLSTNEDLTSFDALFRKGLKLDKYDVFNGDVSRGFLSGLSPMFKQGVRPFTVASNILKSDLIITLGADPQEEAPVVASYIRVATIKNEAKLIDISAGKPPFPGITDVNIDVDGEAVTRFLSELALAVDSVKGRGEAVDDEKLGKIADIAEMEKAEMSSFFDMLVKAEKPVIVIGKHVAQLPDAVTAAANLSIAAKGSFPDGLSLVPLMTSGNSLGALNTMLNSSSWVDNAELDALYVYATGLTDEGTDILEAMSTSRFTVVQTPFMVHPLVNMADVLLPAPAWYEAEGHFCSLEGETRKAEVIVEAGETVKSVKSVLAGMADRFGVSLDVADVKSCENVFVSTVSPDAVKMVDL